MGLDNDGLVLELAEKKKKLGAYYTPQNLCQILANWAITDSNSKILEPSFGQCGFLEASKVRLTELGCSLPKEQIYGCDIDPNAFEFLKKILGSSINDKKFILEDFMKLFSGVHWSNDFNASIGNPPYISAHNLTIDQKKDYIKRWKKIGLNIEQRASLWAHFLLHTTTFIAPNGRLAWVLPGAILQADYAVGIREYLGMIFENTICILMEQRFFLGEGTEEETVILLAKNKLPQENPKPICFAYASTLTELQDIICRWDLAPWEGKFVTARPSYLCTNPDALSVYEDLAKNTNCQKLDSLIKLNIGMVTGANSFFVINEATRKEHDLPKNELRFVLSKIKQAKGLSYSIEDHHESLDTNFRGYLLHVEGVSKNSNIEKYLSQYQQDKIDNNKTFLKRKDWHAPDDNLAPDAFLSVMNHYGPRMVLNEANVNCTNTIHRAYFLDQELSLIQKNLITISLLTSFSQLSAEFTGRRYGSGVLKHEPTEMKKILVFLPLNINEGIISNYYLRIDQSMREGDHLMATRLADELILYPLNEGKKISEILSSELSNTRIRRQRSKYLSGS